MRLFIPDIGDELKLVNDWDFATSCEARNKTLFDAFEIPFEERYHPATSSTWGYYNRNGFDISEPKGDVAFTIRAGSILKVDRVYIRKGQEDFSSITFIVVDSPDDRLVTKKNGGKTPKQIRFWVKLQDTRNIEFEG